jgi:uncharacterized protein YbjQ (UPF0145 family)
MSVCKTCRKPKAPYTCGLCQENTCKSCTQFVGEESFAFLKVIPEVLKHNYYCSNCFDDQVAGPLDEYNETMEKARDIIIYGKDQTKLTRYLKRKEDPYHVDGCVDQEEAVLRMSFYAAQAKFNCLIDVNLTSKKVETGTYKKLVWSGTAVPITIDPNAIRGH